MVKIDLVQYVATIHKFCIAGVKKDIYHAYIKNVIKIIF